MIIVLPVLVLGLCRATCCVTIRWKNRISLHLTRCLAPSLGIIAFYDQSIITSIVDGAPPGSGIHGDILKFPGKRLKIFDFLKEADLLLDLHRFLLRVFMFTIRHLLVKQHSSASTNKHRANTQGPRLQSIASSSHQHFKGISQALQTVSTPHMWNAPKHILVGRFLHEMLPFRSLNPLTPRIFVLEAG